MAQHGKAAGTPAVIEAYDSIARSYDAQYVDNRCEAENREFFDAVPAGDHDVVVDVGCGTGLILDYVAIHPARYLGVDISQGMLQVARERHPAHRFVRGDMRELTRHAGLYNADVIVSGFTAFNYVADHRAVVNQFARVLRPGGRVWINALGPRCVVRETYALYVAGEPVPRFPVRADALASMFMTSGFRDVKVRGMTLVTDQLPTWLPRWAARAFVRLESHTLGRLSPSAGDFILLSATKE